MNTAAEVVWQRVVSMALNIFFLVPHVAYLEDYVRTLGS